MEKQIRVYTEDRGEEGLQRRVRTPVTDFKEWRRTIVIHANNYLKSFTLKDFGYNCVEIGVNKTYYVKLFVSNKDKPVVLENRNK